MTRELVTTVVVILFAMCFNYTNGFHDAANAIATSVSTRALTPRVALGMAARLGRPLKAGQWVSTGALTGVHAIAIGQQARIAFTGLAPMSGTAVAAGPA